jgi:FKBP-type peptidyl-prolyl cis-trans isomerase FkpA
MKLMSWNSIMAIVVVGVGLLSCESGEFKVSEDGYAYKYVRKGDGQLPKNGEIVLYNMKYMDENDSILQQSTTENPLMLQCDSIQWDNMGPLYKALQIIREGDSILVKIPTKTLFGESFKSPVPPSLNPEGEITFCLGLDKIRTQEEMEAEALAQSQEQMDSDIEIIDKYLEENGIDAQSTESGLRYVIDVEGTGNYPEPGDSVKVHYTGTLLGGDKFDSSLDRGEPLPFVIGRRQVIMGWDEGIALLKPGGKGTLYIPSPLAYGARGAGGLIPPNAVLKFDVELIEIN